MDPMHVRKSTLMLLSETVFGPALELLQYDRFECDAAEVNALVSAYLVRTQTETSELEHIVSWGRNWERDAQKLALLINRLSRFVQWSKEYKTRLAGDPEGTIEVARERASWMAEMREEEPNEDGEGEPRPREEEEGGPAPAPAAAQAAGGSQVELEEGEGRDSQQGGEPGGAAVRGGEQDLPARMEVDANPAVPRQRSAPQQNDPRRAAGAVVGPSRQGHPQASTSATQVAAIPAPSRQSSRARESPVAQRQTPVASTSQNGNAHASTSNAIARVPSYQSPPPVRQPSRSRSLSLPPRNQSVTRSNQGNARASTSAAIIEDPIVAEPSSAAYHRLAIPLAAYRVGGTGPSTFEACFIISDGDEIYLAQGPGVHDDLRLMIRGRGTTLVKADIPASTVSPLAIAFEFKPSPTDPTITITGLFDHLSDMWDRRVVMALIRRLGAMSVAEDGDNFRRQTLTCRIQLRRRCELEIGASVDGSYTVPLEERNTFTFPIYLFGQPWHPDASTVPPERVLGSILPKSRTAQSTYRLYYAQRVDEDTPLLYLEDLNTLFLGFSFMHEHIKSVHMSDRGFTLELPPKILLKGHFDGNVAFIHFCFDTDSPDYKAEEVNELRRRFQAHPDIQYHELDATSDDAIYDTFDRVLHPSRDRTPIIVIDDDDEEPIEDQAVVLAPPVLHQDISIPLKAVLSIGVGEVLRTAGEEGSADADLALVLGESDDGEQYLQITQSSLLHPGVLPTFLQFDQRIRAITVPIKVDDPQVITFEVMEEGQVERSYQCVLDTDSDDFSTVNFAKLCDYLVDWEVDHTLDVLRIS